MLLAVPVRAYPFLSDTEIASFQNDLSGLTIGERIAFWAERFVGTPYDTDPAGIYVTRNVIVADDQVDCMYLTFRTIELSLGKTPEESIKIALNKRFISSGLLSGGKVVNYEDRFQYGEDMLDSGKWGREIAGDSGSTIEIKGTRGRDKVRIFEREKVRNYLMKGALQLKSGDIIFFMKSPAKRVVDEMVGHIGTIKREGDILYLIHASGLKGKGGSVKKVLLSDYLKAMPFIGMRISRFDQEVPGD
jgi:hypothetical protein